jgi:hypothetical protein
MSRTPQPRPARRPASRSAARPASRSRAIGMTWGAVGLVIVLVAVLVIVKLSAGPGPTTSSHQAVRPASPTLVRELSTVPASVFNAVGIGIPSQFVGSPPIVISGQPPLTLDGTTPTVLYYGAEYCQYCAAERWAMAVALARFGTWSGLDTTASSLSELDLSTLSFRRATLHSPVIHFAPIEACTNMPDASATGCSGYQTLQSPTRAEQAALNTYAGPKFFPGATGISFPYIDVDNKVLFSGATYQPPVLTGLTQAEIAGGLTDPTNPVTRSIIATANYLTAAICAAAPDAPASIRNSPGVQAAAAALGLRLSGG